MTDAHCHPGHRADESAGNKFVAAITETDWNGLKSLPDGDIPFFGVHPWHADMIDDIESFRLRLSEILKNGFPSSTFAFYSPPRCRCGICPPRSASRREMLGRNAQRMRKIRISHPVVPFPRFFEIRRSCQRHSFDQRIFFRRPGDFERPCGELQGIDQNFSARPNPDRKRLRRNKRDAASFIGS